MREQRLPTKDQDKIFPEQQTIKSIRDLKVYKLAYRLAMEVFEIAKGFPKEETYSLTDQIRRSSRSVASNIREGYAKRRYQHVFTKHLNDAFGSSEETRTWLEFSHDCGYLSGEQRVCLDRGYDEVSAMLYTLMEKWETFDGSES